MPLRRRQHLFALFALLGMLFQQVALAVYVCPHERTDAAAMESMAGCGRAMTGDRARCEAHCHPLASSTDHAPQPTVPAAMLPPTTWLRTAAHAALPLVLGGEREITARAAAPPVTIRLCTFQI